MKNMELTKESHISVIIHLNFDPFENWKDESEKKEKIPQFPKAFVIEEDNVFSTVELHSHRAMLEQLNILSKNFADKKDKSKDLERLEKWKISYEKEIEEETYSPVYIKICIDQLHDTTIKHLFENLNNTYKSLSHLFKAIQEDQNDSFHIETMFHFQFPRDKWNLRNIDFPQRIKFPSAFSSKIGKPSISGFNLVFEDSPIGISEMGLEEDDTKIDLKIIMRLDIERLDLISIFEENFLSCLKINN